MTSNRSDPVEQAKIRADQHRLTVMRRQLETIAATTPSPTLKRIALNAKKEIRL